MLIDRDKAIEAIEHYIDEVRNIPMGASFKAGVKDGYYRAISIIKRLPSAESEAYNLGWKEGREALRKEIWEDGRDRLD